jgi:lysozyme family protein
MKLTPKLRKEYTDLWESMEVKPGDKARAETTARKLLSLKSKYEGYWNVPWWFIALCHYRECSNNFKGVLHNGELIVGTQKKTRLVPANRGPFADWPSATRDALQFQGLDTETDWSIENTSYKLEGFNGYGYHGKGIPSPYLYGGSSVQKPGKYVADHEYDASVVDPQLGTLTILKALVQMDGSIFSTHPQIEPPSEGTVPKEVRPQEQSKPPVKDIPSTPDTPRKPRRGNSGIAGAVVVGVGAVGAYLHNHWELILGSLLVCAIGYGVYRWRRSIDKPASVPIEQSPDDKAEGPKDVKDVT